MAKTPVLGISLKTPAAADKKRARKPKSNKTTLGEKSVPGKHQQHGELSSASFAPRPFTDKEVVKNHARNAKVRATQDWVDGRMDTKDHERVHARANHVLARKQPGAFFGKTGEKAPKGKLAW